MTVQGQDFHEIEFPPALAGNDATPPGFEVGDQFDGHTIVPGRFCRFPLGTINEGENAGVRVILHTAVAVGKEYA